jgi:anionic cell wall polymer biosynthesis LytR-Cps2A-Psr (LCP) family protein
VRKKLLIVLAIVAAVAAIFVGIYFYISAKSKKVFVRPPEPEAFSQIETSDLSGNYTGFLLLGHGGAGHEGGSLMDSMILLLVEPQQKKSLLVSIPRDLWVPIPTDFNNTTNHKINEAYALGLDGGFPNKRPEFQGALGGWNIIKYAVGTVTGVIPKYFIAVDFTGFKKAIEILDGVEVNVPQAYTDNFYPIKGKEMDLCGKSLPEVDTLKASYTGFELEKQFTCRYEQIHFETGKTEMDADTALKYVRSRHGDGDFGRSQRQFAILSAIVSKAVSLGAIPNGGRVLDSLVSTTRTDLDKSEIKNLLQLFGTPDTYKQYTVHLTEENTLKSSVSPAGAFILLPKEGAGNFQGIKDLIKNTISSSE